MTVRLIDLTIKYGSFVAVNGVNADFPRGAVGLLGRNGAGKSSILKSLLGLVRPTGGRMKILDLPEDTPSGEIRRVVGYMPETMADRLEEQTGDVVNAHRYRIPSAANLSTCGVWMPLAP